MKSSLPVVMSLALTPVAVLFMWKLAGKLNLKRANFRGQVIPVAFGFVLFLVLVPVYAIMLALRISDGSTVIFLWAATVFGLLGLADDVFGTREAGGFKGHLGLLRKGRISTGLLKAVGGGCTALLLGFLAAGMNPLAGLLNGLVIGLSANFVNLLDLRPGRAVSCFWIGILAVWLGQSGSMSVGWELYPVLFPAAVLTVLDRKASVMLGDAGSNVLGAILGLVLVYELGLPAKVTILVLLVAVHLYAEAFSISVLIERNRVLRSLDRLLGER